MQPSPPDYQLIARVLAGNASTAERDRLERWADERPENGAAYRVIAQAWEVAGENSPAAHFDAAVDWPAVRARIEASRGHDSAMRPLRRAARRWPLVAASVAAFLIVPLAGLLLVDRGESRAGHDLIAEVSVPRGETREVVLPDGSTVRLAAGSMLRYDDSGDASRLEMELEGLAEFDVVPNPERTFVVRAGEGVETRVLGTRFVVRAYPEAQGVEVAVAEGRVELGRSSAAGNAVQVGRGEVGYALSGESPRVQAAADLEEYFGWTQGRLVIVDRPLKEALTELSRWYDAELKVEDPELAARMITTTAGAAPLDDVIAGIVLALDAGYETRGDTLVLIP